MSKPWKIADDTTGQQWTIIAPDDATEAEVHAFAAENADSWKDGGTYRMELIPEGEAAPAKPVSERNKQVDAALASLKEQLAEVDAEIQQTPTRRFAGPTPALLGPVTGMVDERKAVLRRAELQKQRQDLQTQIDRLEMPAKGATIGGIGGSLLGGAAGVGIGALTGPFAPVMMPTLGLAGAIAGGAGGVAAGTHLYDIPAAREIRDISDQEAVDLIKSRAIESLIWDGVFTIILGPGGRVVGKMANGAKFLPALKASAKEALAWDKIPQVKKEQLQAIITQRADVTPPRISTQVSKALGTPTKKTSLELTEDLLGEIAERTGGRVPTTGEMSGVISGGEQFVRRQAPARFFENDRILSETAESIRSTALSDLDKAGAYEGPEFGTAIANVVKSADRSLKRTAGPVFEEAARQNIDINMLPTLRYLDSVLARDMSAGKALLSSSERADLTTLRNALRAQPLMSAQGAQDFVSGQRAKLRQLSAGLTQPTEFMSKVLGEVAEVADKAFLNSIDAVDPVLKTNLMQTRKLYRQTLGDLYSDAMAKAATKTPEDVGRALTPSGTVTEIRELRAALDRAVETAPAKPRYRGTTMTELGKEQMKAERARIDAGLIKGFIEGQTQTLDNLTQKLRDPKFRLTVKELLVGDGVADPKLGQKVLDELDRTVGVMALIKPELAPQPGRVPVPGMGGMGTTTVVAGTTGGTIKSAVWAAIATLTGIRMVSKMTATAMTSGNTGIFRAAQRAVKLARLAGTSTAAAEALRATLKEISDWDQSTGGEGLDLSVFEPTPQNDSGRQTNMGSRG